MSTHNKRSSLNPHPITATSIMWFSALAAALVIGVPRHADARIFKDPATVTIGPPLQSIAKGDFNRDGNLDVAVTEGVGKGITILLGDGKGGWAPPRHFDVSNILTGFLVTEDFNRDGFLDLVTVNSSRGTLSFLAGLGNGDFSKAEIIAIVDDAQEFAAGDFNIDGIPDLAVVSNTPRKIGILLGKGDGRFSRANFFPAGEEENIRHILAADFNRDGKLDVGISQQTGAAFSVLLGNGKGELTPPKTFHFPPNSRPRAVGLADFDRDGILDVTLSLSGAQFDIWILLGKGNGEFTHHHTIKGQLNHWVMTTGDFNMDGMDDIVTTTLEERVTVFLGRGDGTFSAPLRYPTIGRPPDEFYNTMAVDDFNHDGYTDLITMGESKSTVSLLLNDLAGIRTTLKPEKYYGIKERPIQASMFAVHPSDPSTILLATANQGVFRSKNRGRSWHPANRGILNTIVYTIAMDPVNPEVAYAGTWGGGIYKTVDGGDSWTEANKGLTHTAVNNVIVDPENPKTIYASTSMRVFASHNAGESWEPIGRPEWIIPPSNRFYRSTMILVNSDVPTLFLGIDKGFLTWNQKDNDWTVVEGPLSDKKISALSFDRATGTLYAASERTLFKSADMGKTWSDMVDKLGQRRRITNITIPEDQPGTIMLLDSFMGLYISRDYGETWEITNKGLDGARPRALTIDPQNPKRMIIGSYARGFFLSKNSGKSWKKIKKVDSQSIDETLALIIESEGRTPGNPPPPNAFAKCNQCHGWTRPELKFFRKNHWQMAPSNRDWALTVWRMGYNARLTPAELGEIITYMNKYYGLDTEN